MKFRLKFWRPLKVRVESLVGRKMFETRMRAGFSYGAYRDYDAVCCPFCDEVFEIYFNVEKERNCPKCGSLHNWKTGVAKKPNVSDESEETEHV